MRAIVSLTYWWGQAILRSLLRSRLEERRWRLRTRREVRLAFPNVELAHRDWLVDRLLSDGSVSDVLEVGSGWGPNLEVLARRAPNLRLTGVDISPASVVEGNARFAERGLSNITLHEGNADNLRAFTTGCVDVAFTDALLIYIDKYKIQKSIEEMMRLARRRVVLLEMHQTGAGAGGRYTRDGWVRDYDALLRPIAGEAAVRLTPLPRGIWTAGRWPKFGMLAEIDMTKLSTR